NPGAALSYDQGVGQLHGQKIGGQQLMDAIAILVSQPAGLVRILLHDEPFERCRAVDHISHSGNGPRNSRMISTPIFWTPNLRRFSSAMRSIRSAAWRIASRSRIPLAALCAASSSSANNSG